MFTPEKVIMINGQSPISRSLSLWWMFVKLIANRLYLSTHTQMGRKITTGVEISAAAASVMGKSGRKCSLECAPNRRGGGIIYHPQPCKAEDELKKENPVLSETNEREGKEERREKGFQLISTLLYSSLGRQKHGQKVSACCSKLNERCVCSCSLIIISFVCFAFE